MSVILSEMKFISMAQITAVFLKEDFCILPFKDFGLSSEEFSKYSSFSALMTTPLTATVIKPMKDIS